MAGDGNGVHETPRRSGKDFHTGPASGRSPQKRMQGLLFLPILQRRPLPDLPCTGIGAGRRKLQPTPPLAETKGFVRMNPNELMDKLGLNAEEMTELVTLFVDTCRQDLEQMAAALAAGDARGVSEAAHSIKGAAGNMRFQEIYELARSIEEDARQRILAGVAPRMDEIRSAIREIGRRFDVPSA
jgi:HPt (histidine-containing phosphotransfer) domain-containing protein